MTLNTPPAADATPLDCLNELHHKVLSRLYRDSKIVPAYLCEGAEGFRFKRGSKVYNVRILTDLRAHRLINENNFVTTEGVLWAVMNGVQL